MGYKSKLLDLSLYYEEKTTSERKRRYCLKPIKLVESKAAKDPNFINIQFNRGNKTNINIDKVEEGKICEHFEYVIAKLQKLHKGVMWNMCIGRSLLEKTETLTVAKEEAPLESSNIGEFGINNVKTWNKDCISHIENTLRVNEIPNDGLVCLFSVANDDSEHDIDSDEIAWEIEKVVVYHCVDTYGQRLLNQEGSMARQGLDPISRKVRTPDRNRSGYVVYLAYQLVDSITFSQVMVETVLYGVDIEQKKKQILHQLGDMKMSPQVDDMNRKVIKDVKEFMGKEQVEILHQLKDMKDVHKLSIVSQFIQLLQAGGERQGGMAGLNQFVTFLSTKDGMASSPSRQSMAGGNSNGSRTTSNSVRTRKQSSSSLSSCSTIPESPRSNSAGSRKSPSPGSAPKKKTLRSSKRQSSLADIPSDHESLSSGADTFLSTNNKNKKNSCVQADKVSKGPRRTMSLQENNEKLRKKGNVKTSRAVSVNERPGGMGEREEDGKDVHVKK